MDYALTWKSSQLCPSTAGHNPVPGIRDGRQTSQHLTNIQPHSFLTQYEHLCAHNLIPWSISHLFLALVYHKWFHYLVLITTAIWMHYFITFGAAPCHNNHHNHNILIWHRPKGFKTISSCFKNQIQAVWVTSIPARGTIWKCNPIVIPF